MKPYFLVVSINLWGGGRTYAKALENLKSKKVRLSGNDPLTVYIFSIEDNTSLENLPYCDMIGQKMASLPQIKYLPDIQQMLARFEMTYKVAAAIESIPA